MRRRPCDKGTELRSSSPMDHLTRAYSATKYMHGKLFDMLRANQRELELTGIGDCDD